MCYQRTRNYNKVLTADGRKVSRMGTTEHNNVRVYILRHKLSGRLDTDRTHSLQKANKLVRIALSRKEKVESSMFLLNPKNRMV